MDDAGASGPMKILIAHERASERGLLTAAMERWGHACTAVRGAVEAMEAVREQEYDVVFCGWAMASFDALDLCRHVRDRQVTPYTYLILATPPENKAQALRAVRAGADDYVVEPLQLDELQARLTCAERVLRLRRQEATRATWRRALVELMRQAPAGADPADVFSGLLTEVVGPVALLDRLSGAGDAELPRNVTPILPAASAHTPLSKREQEVALLMARGLSNREIAEHLIIGARTAESHAANVLTKLGLNSRAQVAAWAVRHGLVAA
jgi:DNA-binding NarL/FixJ family response regulator